MINLIPSMEKEYYSAVTISNCTDTCNDVVDIESCQNTLARMHDSMSTTSLHVSVQFDIVTAL